jgi:aldehyde dehydrogenase (NAD+)
MAPTKAGSGHSRARLVFGDLWDFDPAPETADPKLKPRYELFIGGKFVRPRSGRYFDSINPANERKLAEVALAGPADVDAAYAAAARAFRPWSALPGREQVPLQDRAPPAGPCPGIRCRRDA